jgi:DNA-directed RNA polymerase alpha subunit
VIRVENFYDWREFDIETLRDRLERVEQQAEDVRQRAEQEAERLVNEGNMLRARIAAVMADPRQIPLQACLLSVRSWNCLIRADGPNTNGSSWGWDLSGGWEPPTSEIRTLGDLVKWSRADLLRLKNLGAKSLKEIESVVRSYGLELAQ